MGNRAPFWHLWGGGGHHNHSRRASAGEQSANPTLATCAVSNPETRLATLLPPAVACTMSRHGFQTSHDVMELLPLFHAVISGQTCSDSRYGSLPCWTTATFDAQYKQRRCRRVNPDGSFHLALKGDEGPREAARYESLISLSDSRRP